VKHYAAPDFWACYRQLPAEVQQLAEKLFELLKADPNHPSIRFKKVNQFWSARVGLHHRALAIQVSDGRSLVLDRHSRGI